MQSQLLVNLSTALVNNRVAKGLQRVFLFSSEFFNIHSVAKYQKKI